VRIERGVLERARDLRAPGKARRELQAEMQIGGEGAAQARAHVAAQDGASVDAEPVLRRVLVVLEARGQGQVHSPKGRQRGSDVTSRAVMSARGVALALGKAIAGGAREAHAASCSGHDRDPIVARRGLPTRASGLGRRKGWTDKRPRERTPCHAGSSRHPTQEGPGEHAHCAVFNGTSTSLRKLTPATAALGGAP
jgi:hypothetical protein